MSGHATLKKVPICTSAAVAECSIFGFPAMRSSETVTVWRSPRATTSIVAGSPVETNGAAHSVLRALPCWPRVGATQYDLLLMRIA